MNKLLIIIVIGVLVVGVGAIGYFAFIRNSPTMPAIQKQSDQVSPQEVIKQTPIQSTQEQTTPRPTEKSEVSLNGWTKYTDSQNRFSFSYPPTFGTPSEGTNNSFGDRVVALKFSKFSWGQVDKRGIFGGEVVLTNLAKDFVSVDIQALGGLYDPIMLETIPEDLRFYILANLPMLTTKNFCGELAKEHHIDKDKSGFTSSVMDTIDEIDQTRNIDPKVIRCDVVEDTVTFHKEVTARFGQFESRQNIYGAIRFLKSPFSSFQIIRATAEAPTKEMLNNITLVVKSFK